jgi:1,4-dihydroxy-2-naphthoate octaprenyltransferase
MPSDRAAGKRTLANLLGRRAANAEYALLVVSAYAIVALLIVVDPRFWPLSIVLASVPHAISLLRLLPSAGDAPTLNVVLRRTAGLHLRFGLLVTGGLLARALINAF